MVVAKKVKRRKKMSSTGVRKAGSGDEGIVAHGKKRKLVKKKSRNGSVATTDLGAGQLEGKSTKRKSKKRTGPAGATKATAWKRWLSSTDLTVWAQSQVPSFAEHLDTKGIVRVDSLFPIAVAEAVLGIIKGLPEHAWDLSEQAGDEDAAVHRFSSIDVCDVPQLSDLRTAFWRLLPEFRGEPTLPIFSVGRYGRSDHIGRHDDRAHVPFFSDDNIYSRTVAAIWYLTEDWSEEDGGCLLDLEAVSGRPDKFVPRFNSCVLFPVPHMHAVSPVVSDRFRYSIFGWWHQRGKRYALPGDGDEEPAIGRARKGPKKKLKNKSGKCRVA